MTRGRRLHRLSISAGLLAGAVGAGAQSVDYHRADLIRVGAPYVYGTTVAPTWLEDSTRFWYQSSGTKDRGAVYLVDPARGTRRVLFDNARLSAALSVASDTILDPARLPTFKVVENAAAIEIPFLRKRPWRCEIASYRCVALDSAEYAARAILKDGPAWVSRSPDRKWDVFSYRSNLYVRSAALTDAETVATRDSAIRARKDTARRSGDTKPAARSDSVPLPSSSVQLTTDGEQFHDYANARLGNTSIAAPPSRPVQPAVSWAPDSRHIALAREDRRNLRRFPIYGSTADQPVDHSYIWATPGDSVYATFSTYVIDVTTRALVKVQDTPSPSMNFNPAYQWSRGSDKLFLVNSSRGYKRMSIQVADVATGAVRRIMTDSVATWLDFYDGPWERRGRAFVVTNGGDDIFWVSQRDGWGHIYRYGPDGTLKNQVDVGPFATRWILHVDSAGKRLWFAARGRESGNPYHYRIYRVNFDGSGLTLLTTEDARHMATFAPRGGFFIDDMSRADLPSVTLLRSSESGKIVAELGRGDVELFQSLGWRPPREIKVKARDGVTDLYGLLYLPSTFDSTKVYPIIDHIYPGPQSGSVSTWGWEFIYAAEAHALAEVGFVVLELDHFGSPGRSKSFHDYYFGNMGDNGIPDHIAGIRQLAARYPWIDITRVGIFGASGGGFASTDAILRYPDFYKVAVSMAGNHDQRTYGTFWGEKYQGLLTKDASGRDNYDASANYTLAKNLKGKLFLMHGEMDANVHPAHTLRVVDALIKANKDFDMLIFPGAGHEVSPFLPYVSKRMWDYFVRHLLGTEPPDYQMIQWSPLSR